MMTYGDGVGDVNLDKLLEFIPTYNKDDRYFNEWVDQAEKKFIELLTK